MIAQLETSEHLTYIIRIASREVYPGQVIVIFTVTL